MATTREDQINLIKTDALKVGGETRSIVLITVDHDGRSKVSTWHHSLPDLMYMKELLSQIIRETMDKK